MKIKFILGILLILPCTTFGRLTDRRTTIEAPDRKIVKQIAGMPVECRRLEGQNLRDCLTWKYNYLWRLSEVQSNNNEQLQTTENYVPASDTLEPTQVTN